MTPKEGEQSFLDKTQVVRAWLYQQPLFFFFPIHFILLAKRLLYPFYPLLFRNLDQQSHHRPAFFPLSFQLFLLFMVIVWGFLGFGAGAGLLFACALILLRWGDWTGMDWTGRKMREA